MGGCIPFCGAESYSEAFAQLCFVLWLEELLELFTGWQSRLDDFCDAKVPQNCWVEMSDSPPNVIGVGVLRDAVSGGGSAAKEFL